MSTLSLILMLTTLSGFFYRIASWKTLVLGVILYVPFPAYFFKNLEASMNAQAGYAIGPIDLLFGYNPAKISQMVDAYGAVGRAIYAQGELTIDIAYPFIYTFLFCVILSLLFRHRPYPSFRLVNVLPVGILAFDLLENSCIVYLLKTYPDSSNVVASLCSLLTNLKWTITMIVLGLAVYGLIKLAMRGTQKELEQG